MSAPVLLMLGWMLIALLSSLGVWDYWRGVAVKRDAPAATGVAVLVPIRGAADRDWAQARFLDSCLTQRGVSYRLIFAVESLADPAAAALARLAASDARVSLVVAGRATRRGQKVQNQLAALATLGSEDRFVVFADADTVFAPEWLAQLVRPLALGRAQLSSGYRWILPADDHPASRLCALMDWGIATAMRSRRWNLCWGGSMAITRAALERIDLPRCWDQAVDDDLVLTSAARRAGMEVHATPMVLAPSPVRHDWASLVDFGRRQYLFVRVHAPLHWSLAGFTLAVPMLGALAAIQAVLQGRYLALAPLLLALALQQVRAELRLGIARRVLPADEAAQSGAILRRGRAAAPAAHLLHLAIWLTSAVGSTMTWGGVRYRLLGPGRVEIIGRRTPDEPVAATRELA